jgi:ADP-heptose:LPS heptosyltransferase
MSKHFLHSGAMGDVIYSLPTIKAMGGGVLHLVDTRHHVDNGEMTKDWQNLLTPLLKVQPYIVEVRYDYVDGAIDLNRFRKIDCNLSTTNLVYAHAKAQGIEVDLTKPWLEPIKGEKKCGAVFARSARYHSADFPWLQIVRSLREFAQFIGTPDEHKTFCKEFDCDYLTQVPTNNLYDVAKSIAENCLFVGNQSSPLAIAHGLGVPVLMEVCSANPNCVFNRPNEYVNLENISHALRIASTAKVDAREPPGNG